MRLLFVIGFAWTAVLLAVFAPSASGQTGGADPTTWPTPNPHPNWYYYDLGPFDDASYRSVSIAEIVADPFQFDGQLVRVRGTFLFGDSMVRPCHPSQPTGTPTVEPGFLPLGLSTSLVDSSGEVGVLIWGKQGDSLASQDRLAYASDAEIELRGILRASYRNPGCNPNRQIASAYLAIQRTDPAIRFTQSAQSIGRKLTALPPGGLQDEVQPTATPTP
jgi:hypothetical protein